MSAQAILDEVAITPGWNDDTKLILACDFIDSIKDGADKFQKFLEERAAEEADECEDDDD